MEPQTSVDGASLHPIVSTSAPSVDLPTPYWQRDGITIYNGDCREILPKLGRFDLVLTDPPYGVSYSTWDKDVPRPQDWLYRCIAIADTVYVTPGNGQAVLYPHPTWTMAWFRPGSVQRVREGSGFSHWEPVLVYGKNIAKVDAKQIKAKPQKGCGWHPCPKPLELFRWLIGTVEGCKTVCDPFVGSGTTLEAAMLEGVEAVGIEKSKEYCDKIIERLSQGVLF